MDDPTEEIDLGNGIKEIYKLDREDPTKKRLIFKLDSGKKTLIYFPDPTDNFFCKEIIFEGVVTIPDEVSEMGYIKAGLEYYLNKKFNTVGAKTLTISKTKKSEIKKTTKSVQAILNYSDLKWLKQNLTRISTQAKEERSELVDEFFSSKFPKKFKAPKTSSKGRAKRAISLLDDTIIEHLEEKDLEKVLLFIQSFITKRYKSDTYKQKLFNAAKLKVDEIGITEIINQFESLLKKSPLEDEWSKFLKRNLFLFDSRYIKIIDQLNVVLSTARKVDFGLIDVSGFLDLFEIKRSSTQLLSKTTDRGNYYWSSDAIKAITQLEKYLYNAEIKSSSLKTDIEREHGDISVSVIKPRAFLIIGSKNQLDNKNKVEDFRVLRRSLKNIEIILFDELLEQLKNQKGKIYID